MFPILTVASSVLAFPAPRVSSYNWEVPGVKVKFSEDVQPYQDYDDVNQKHVNERKSRSSTIQSHLRS